MGICIILVMISDSCIKRWWSFFDIGVLLFVLVLKYVFVSFN